MGSSSLSQVPTNFRHSVHPFLQSAQLNKHSGLLGIKIHPGLGLANWKWNLSPLEPHAKHLLLPVALVDPQLQGHEPTNWCTEELEIAGEEQIVIAQYEPYIYTLDKEIMARRDKSLPFKEQEVWRILKAGILAIHDWGLAYPDLTLGPIIPLNVVFNNLGLIKLVHRFSFLEQEDQHPSSLPNVTSSPSIGNATLGPSMFPESPVSSQIFSLGMTLLDAVSLNKTREKASE
jgi:hypothetical protein